MSPDLFIYSILKNYKYDFEQITLILHASVPLFIKNKAKADTHTSWELGDKVE